MSGIAVAGIGAVSPAGWGVAALRDAVAGMESITLTEISRPGWPKPLRVRRVPAPTAKPPFMAHPRLRRTSPITTFSVAAVMESLGDDAVRVTRGEMRLGIIFCVFSGCVNYTRRFYDETWHDPASASPLVFPETVFNAPASHLAAVLGTTGINYTLVGDGGTFLQALAMGADWLTDGRVDGCVIAGAEEVDWLVADAFRHFQKRVAVSEGAAAVYLVPAGNEDKRARLHAVSSPRLFLPGKPRTGAISEARNDLATPMAGELLCDGLQGAFTYDAPEVAAWKDWAGPRLSPKKVLGEGFMAAAGWQCVAAIERIKSGLVPAASVSVAGPNQQAIAARFVSPEAGG